MVGEGHREPHVVLRSEDDRLSGFGGCNRLMGSYELDGASIRFGPVAGTMIACPQGEDTEHKLAIALDLTRSWRIVGQHLELLDQHGEPTARFEARYLE